MDHDALLALNNLERAIATVTARISHRLEAEADITYLQHQLLFRLVSAADGRLRTSELAAILDVSPSVVTRHVDRLADRGWVTRWHPGHNRKLVHAEITEQGRRYFFERTAPAYGHGLREDFAQHLERGDIANLQRIARQLLKAYDDWDDERCATRPVTR